MDKQSMHDFIIRAKAATYVGSDQPAPACRPNSHDLKFSDGDWSYLDSYFGGRGSLARKWFITRENPSGP